MSIGREITNLAIEKLTCIYCKAKPGLPCKTISGRWAQVHTLRWHEARSLFFARGPDGFARRES
jgi:hypothetical protein